MPYLGRQPSIGRFAHLDDITSSFNSACTTFSLMQSSVALVPGAASNLIISLGGVLQEPEVAYTVAGSSIIFSSAPASTQPFFGILLGDVLDVGQVSQGAVINATSLTVTGAATLSNTLAVTGAATLSNTLAVTGATTLSSTVATGALTVTGAATYTTSLKSTTALATPAALTATQATAFASTVSGSAIMGFGTTNDVSLMNRAGTVVLGIGPNTTAVNMAGALGVTGLLTVSGSGAAGVFTAANAGANYLQIRNTTSGTGAYATLYLGNNVDGAGASLNFFSSAFTTAGPAVAAGVSLVCDYAGGISIASQHASGAIRFYSGGTTQRWAIGTDGTLTGASNIIEIGASTYRATGATGTAYMGYVTSQAQFEILFNSTSVGVRLTSGANAWAALSDARLKTTLTPFTDAAATLRGVRTGTGRYLIDDSSISRSFMIAQDFETGLPEAITRDETDGMLVLRYTDTIPLIISGWQQHDKELFDNGVSIITQLAARIAALESQDN